MQFSMLCTTELIYKLWRLAHIQCNQLTFADKYKQMLQRVGVDGETLRGKKKVRKKSGRE